MRLFKYYVILLLSTLVSFAYAANTDLKKAKDQLLVGEMANGYVGYVVKDTPEAITKVVKKVNNTRRDKYRKMAKKNGLSLNEVEQYAGAKAMEKTSKGHYIQDSDGKWKVK